MTLTPALNTLNPTQIWNWRGYSICYQQQGETGMPVVLVHGFGASWRHWRNNIPSLAQQFRVYAIDLLGFGASDKPAPDRIDYTFETWGQQLADFCQEVVGAPAVLVGNSIGCLVIMQAAVDHPDRVAGVALLNCSLRLLHDRRRAQLPWYRRLGAPLLQQVLSVRWLGHTFFRSIAKRNTVKKILLKAYARPAAVTDELVDFLLAPAADVGAADVFLAFTRYSYGPLPEDLLEKLPCRALLLWGENDPWEPIDLGRKLADYPCVDRFVAIENAGHCPQDEAPEIVNPTLQEWIAGLWQSNLP